VNGYPLEGVRVLDLTQYVAGPYFTQVLADLGATILKVERPNGGDVYRRQGPVFANGESASFLTLNRGKRSIRLDLGVERDRARLHELVAEADAAGHGVIRLATFSELHAAARLYRSFGFEVVGSHYDDRWGRVLLHQDYERRRA